MDSLSKLKRINQIIREDKSKETREKKIVQLQQIMAQKFYFETLSNGINPLNPISRWGNLKTQKCKLPTKLIRKANTKHFVLSKGKYRIGRKRYRVPRHNDY